MGGREYRPKRHRWLGTCRWNHPGQERENRLQESPVEDRISKAKGTNSRPQRHERTARMSCALTENCIFFNDKMANMPSMAKMYKERYCGGDFEACARYRVFKDVGRENVPRDLYPNEANRVDDVISQAKAAG
jgi:hypothetical protein